MLFGVKTTARRFLAALAVGAVMIGAGDVKAQNIQFCEGSTGNCRAQANDHRIGLIAGAAGTTYIEVAEDIKNAVNAYFRDRGEPPLRVLPMVGVGSIKNVEDLLYLDNTDIGLVQADVLEMFRRINQDNGKYSAVLDNIKYLAKVYNEEVHLVCRRGACGNFLGEETAGIVLNIGEKGSGTWMTSRLLLSGLGFEEKNFRYMPTKEALGWLRNPDKAPADKKIDGMILVAGTPVGRFAEVSQEENLELVPIISRPGMPEIYVRGSIEPHESYAGLMWNRASVRTVAVPAVLAVYGYEKKIPLRYENLRRFSKALVAQAKDLRDGARSEPPRYHEKWSDWDPSVEIKGWKRHKLMEEALDQASPN